VRSRRETVRLLTLVSVAVLAIDACGGGSSSSGSTSASTPPATTTVAATPRPKPPGPSYPQVLGVALRSGPTHLVPAVRWHGQTAVWLARLPSGVALLVFDQRLVVLRLHSGTADAGGAGWRFGPSATRRELHTLVAAFNGGFRLSTGAGGFMSFGRVAVPLRSGLGSIVTYADGHTDVGAWHHGLPAPGAAVVSVRQNLSLLVDGGRPASSVGCSSCWGATLGGVSDPARGALGVTADGRLVWAGGEKLTVAELAGALVSAGVVRAVELDINPEWVAAYLYGHRGGHGPLAPIPVMPAQHGIPGEYLAPWSRDFFTVDVR